MTALYLYDDARARTFEPFALTRPVAELRAGTTLLRERWERALAMPAAGTVAAPHLADFEETGAPPSVGESVPAGAIIANARCVVPLGWTSRVADVWLCEGAVAAVRVSRPVPIADFDGGGTSLDSLTASGTRLVEVPGRWLREVWQLVTELIGQLQADIAAIGPTLTVAPPHQAIHIGSHPVYVEQGATVEPHVVFDCSGGPVLVRAGAVVRSFTRLVGPCAIAGGTSVLGDRVAGCSIGEGCTVRGELSESVFLGQANKSHDGFVGHSYLGRWVNLGAGTITSNLKNTYGTVSMWTPAGMRDSGTIKLGSLIGDHVKTGIGMRLTTGSVIGAGSNLYGNSMLPKYVAPFSWGEGASLAPYRLDKFLETAERAMARRQVTLGERARRALAAAHERGRRSG
ncbi:MAG: putative sugar nucleotidyl transferase [Gemmatimonadaceae bacterium]